MTDLRVPKRRVAVEIVLPGGAARRVTVFLADAAPGHGGGERLSDLLNGRDEFVPAFDEDAGVLTFLNRAAVALARAPRDLEAEEADEITIPTEHEVEITLADGQRLRGVVSYVLPPDHSRLVDFLNDRAPFFRLLEPGALTLVSRRHVARVAIVAR